MKKWCRVKILLLICIMGICVIKGHVPVWGTSNLAEIGPVMINNVAVTGNKVTIVINGFEEADGYDYVISNKKDYGDYYRDWVQKNILTTYADFYYVAKGKHYVYCRAWKYDENGEKVFGKWSEFYEFQVMSATPDSPVIINTQAEGTVVDVKYKTFNVQNISGYEVVLASRTERINGEICPVGYGTLVKETGKNSYSVIFRNVPEGRYYIGVRAFNKDLNVGKIYSPWSNIKEIKVGSNVSLKKQTVHVDNSFTKICKPNEKFSLRAYAYGKLSYKSENKKIVTVSSTGNVTMKACGSTTIVIKAAETLEYKAATVYVSVTLVPGKTGIHYISSNETGKITISWSGSSGAKCYQIQFSTNKNFTSAQTKTGYLRKEKLYRTYTSTVSNFTKKKWYIRIRGYSIINGKTSYGSWSNVKSIDVK